MKRLLSPDLDQFLRQAQQELDQALRRTISPVGQPIANLDDGVAYAMGLDPSAANPGKRLRPCLCLLVCEDLGGSRAAAMPFAVAIELMHNFCLVHDDVEDGDAFRRGRPSVWNRFGLAHAVNIGDYLFTKIFAALLADGEQLPDALRLAFFGLMAEALDHTHRGQALDMNARGKTISVPEYMQLVTEKTGYYLAAPLVAGSVAAGAPAGVQQALQRYGLLIGPMFQIRDDLIDLTRDKGREAAGSDIREGKRSFLVACTFEQASEAHREDLLQLLDLPREQTTARHVERAIELFESYGALGRAEQTCLELEQKALATLADVPAPLRPHLEEVTHYLASRAT